MAEEYEVKVTVGDATVEVRGAEKGVVAIVEALSQILSPGSRETKEPEEETRRGERRKRRVDPRTLFAEKKPSTQREAVAVAAFYLQELAPEAKRSGTIDATKLQEVFRQANWKLPKAIGQLLVDTSKAGYLDRVGTGEYELNSVGYNLVVHTLGANE